MCECLWIYVCVFACLYTRLCRTHLRFGLEIKNISKKQKMEAIEDKSWRVAFSRIRVGYPIALDMNRYAVSTLASSRY